MATNSARIAQTERSAKQAKTEQRNSAQAAIVLLFVPDQQY
jgi:hypothetical protein